MGGKEEEFNKVITISPVLYYKFQMQNLLSTVLHEILPGGLFFSQTKRYKIKPLVVRSNLDRREAHIYYHVGIPRRNCPKIYQFTANAEILICKHKYVSKRVVLGKGRVVIKVLYTSSAIAQA